MRQIRQCKSLIGIYSLAIVLGVNSCDVSGGSSSTPTLMPTYTARIMPTYLPTPTLTPTYWETPILTYSPTLTPSYWATPVPTTIPTYSPTPTPSYWATPTPMPTSLPTPTPIPTSSPISTSFTIPYISENDRVEYLNAVNNARAQRQDCGSEGVFNAAPALVWSDQLYRAAYEHSYDLANTNTFSHAGSGTIYDITAQKLGLTAGSSMRQRIDNYDYQWSNIGENIAAGYDNIETTVALWMASDGHCANIMNPNFTEMGIGYLEKDDTDYYYYWTQNFGRPK